MTAAVKYEASVVKMYVLYVAVEQIATTKVKMIDSAVVIFVMVRKRMALLTSATVNLHFLSC